MGGRGSWSGGRGHWGGGGIGMGGGNPDSELFKYGSLGGNEKLESAIENVETDLFYKYPALRESSSLRTVDENSNAYAYVYMGGDTVYINKKYFANPDIEAKYANDVKQGYHPKGTTAADIVAHEYGHVAHNMLLKKYTNGSTFLGRRVNSQNDAVTILTQTATRNANKLTKRKLGINDWAKSISGYANSNKHEMVAEAFADFYANGNKAKTISKEIMKLLRGELQ